MLVVIVAALGTGGGYWAQAQDGSTGGTSGTGGTLPEETVVATVEPTPAPPTPDSRIDEILAVLENIEIRMIAVELLFPAVASDIDAQRTQTNIIRGKIDGLQNSVNAVLVDTEALTNNGEPDWAAWTAEWDAWLAASAESAIDWTVFRDELATMNQSATGLNTSATAMFEIMRAWILSQPQPGQAATAVSGASIQNCNQCSFP